MKKFDSATFQDFVASHGYGVATAEGVSIGEQLFIAGDDYATAAAEVVTRGMVSPAEEIEEA